MLSYRKMAPNLYSIGFTINSHSYRTIEQSLITVLTANLKPLPWQPCNQCHQSYSRNETFIFCDIEPSSIIGRMENGSIFIPCIRELACCAVPATVYLDTAMTMDDVFLQADVTVLKDLTTHYEYIQQFLKICQRYPNPIIVAHNGHNFDFIILKAYATRYLENSTDREYIYKLDTFDTYWFSRKTVPKINPQTNSSLFWHYIDEYPQCSEYRHNVHTAEYDTRMLMCWFKQVISTLRVI
ncbi:hypothetical protein CcNV_076 [Crangon crangon nudivirus]|uniref:Exonuclease domain-containing protein n=1 Tax=Crangon crangon nudivirus TaxID=2880838 RepID=A0AAE8Y0N6_9VIRU|nr:hypothetical protein QKT25_gp077 [Crangon crangon nudivirus]UBZ25561.1 hypothetical protein CcNV_076 [Crangon crangon nudivirus]